MSYLTMSKFRFNVYIMANFLKWFKHLNVWSRHEIKDLHNDCHREKEFNLKNVIATV